MKKSRLLLVIVALAIGFGTAIPAAADFNSLTSRIDQIGNVDRQWIPLFGLGRLFVRVFKPEGVRDMKLAVFEDHTDGRDIDLAKLVGDNIDRDWKRVVRSTTRWGEEAFVYMREEESFVRLMVVSREDSEIVVVETALDPDTFAEHLMDGSLGEHRGR